MSARDVYHRVLAGHATADDIAVLLVRWKANELSAPREMKALLKHWRFHSSHAHSAQAARHELMAFVRQHADNDQQLFTTEIILGELLANTVEHAPGLVEITIDWTGRRPILLVRDGGSGFEVDGKQLPSTALSEDGRGLYLVRSLSDRVAIRPAQGFGSEMEVQLPIDKTPCSTHNKRGDPQTRSADDG